MARFKGDKGSSTRKLPKAKPKKKSRKAKGSSWGLFGVAASIITTAAVAIFRLSKQRKVDTLADRNVMRRMLLRPLQITEHGACRMDCRSVHCPRTTYATAGLQVSPGSRSFLQMCRHISKGEVYRILEEGHVNNRKSNPLELPCPKYVVDAQVGKPTKNVQVSHP